MIGAGGPKRYPRQGLLRVAVEIRNQDYLSVALAGNPDFQTKHWIQLNSIDLHPDRQPLCIVLPVRGRGLGLVGVRCVRGLCFRNAAGRED